MLNHNAPHTPGPVGCKVMSRRLPTKKMVDRLDFPYPVNYTARYSFFRFIEAIGDLAEELLRLPFCLGCHA
jgi:hypothetical protein